MKTPGTAYTSVKTVRERQRKRPPLSAPPLSPPYLSLTSPPPSQLYFAEDMNPRCRSTMEDASAVVDGFGGDGGTGYFGVYDGHGGRNVAEFLRLHLHVNVERELQVKGDRSAEECLRAAFLYTDLSCHATGEQASGSTSVVCIVRRAGAARCVYTANCGDARAVLCHGAAAVRLSKDHKATDAAERARIEAGGGFVVRKRVMGVLAVARSFGDFTLKKFVSAEPYTSTTVLSEEVRARPRASRARPRATRGTARLTPPPHPPTHFPPAVGNLLQSQFIIIACDGVWDVLEDQEAVDMVRSFLAGAGGLADGVPAARILVDAALAKGSSDNVTAMVVLL